jgi:hypothetical protein
MVDTRSHFSTLGQYDTRLIRYENMNINNPIENSDEFSSIYIHKNDNLKETLKQHYEHIC